MKFCFFLFFFSLFSIDTFAIISIKIVDLPEETFVYSPVTVIGVIENTGDYTEAVNLTDSLNFEISQANQYLPLPVDAQHDVGEHYVIILHPGEKYYVSKQIWRGFAMIPPFMQEGLYEIRMILSGGGQCIPSRLSKPHDLQPDISSSGERTVYQCWRGKIYSPPAKITVWNPSSKKDLQVLEFIRSTVTNRHRDFPPYYLTGIDFARAYEILRVNYPDNYYTFVAGLYAAAVSFGQPHLVLKQTLDLQPEHPMRKYALTKLAIEEIDRSFTLDKSLQSKLSPAIWEYLEQYKSEVESWKNHPH